MTEKFLVDGEGGVTDVDVYYGVREQSCEELAFAKIEYIWYEICRGTEACMLWKRDYLRVGFEPHVQKKKKARGELYVIDELMQWLLFMLRCDGRRILAELRFLAVSNFCGHIEEYCDRLGTMNSPFQFVKNDVIGCEPVSKGLRQRRYDVT